LQLRMVLGPDDPAAAEELKDGRGDTAVLLRLAVFGAGTQCVAGCLPHPNTPPCHQHSQKKSLSPAIVA